MTSCVWLDREKKMKKILEFFFFFLNNFLGVSVTDKSIGDEFVLGYKKKQRRMELSVVYYDWIETFPMDFDTLRARPR